MTKAGKGIAVGLKAAGLHLQRRSQYFVPVETGILKESAFTRASGSSQYTVVRVGYTASYAIYVHENMNAAHGAEYNKKYGRVLKSGKHEKLRAPQQQAKFLERPAREERSEMLAIIESRIKAYL